MDGIQPKNNIDFKKTGIFILLAYILAWIPEFWYFSAGGTLSSGWFILLAVSCMFTPAIAAIILQKTLVKAPLSEIGLHFTFNKWFVIAPLIAITVVLLSVPFSALLSETELTNGLPYITEQINKSTEIASSEREIALQALEQFGSWLPFMIIVGGIIGSLIAGPTLNAIPALGEELGWRGFLYKELKPLGFWTSSIIIGVIWGFWHLPLIIHGYNYPEAPVAGIFMMVLFTVLLSPIFTHIREQSDTVLVPAVFHGTLNAIAGLPFLFFAGASHLIIGAGGLAGAIVLILVNILIFTARKSNSEDSNE